MARKNKNLSGVDPKNSPSAEGMSFHIVTSEWNPEITSALESGARETLENLGCKAEDIHILAVPGSFELPAAAKLVIQTQKTDGVICLGCVIKGETRHDEYISQAVATGLTQLSILSGKPVIFGVLTTDNMEQAQARAGGSRGNKGVEAAVTAVKMATLKRSLTQEGTKIGF